eukprot:COSAG02_NODE_16487_length_1079_cov_5.213265_2_plen_190_part_00
METRVHYNVESILYLYYQSDVNFDWCRKVQLHGDSWNSPQGSPECGRCTSGPFFPAVTPGITIRRLMPGVTNTFCPGILRSATGTPTSLPASSEACTPPTTSPRHLRVPTSPLRASFLPSLHFPPRRCKICNAGQFPPRRCISDVRLFPPRSCNVRPFPPGRHGGASSRQEAPLRGNKKDPSKDPIPIS